MRRYLIAGLLVWVPLGITLWVLHFLLTSLDQILLVEEILRPAADLAGRERVARDDLSCAAGADVPHLDRRTARGRCQNRAGEKRDATDHLPGF